MEAIASAKYLRGSAQKARLVVDMIRGKRVGEALAIPDCEELFLAGLAFLSADPPAFE